MFFSYRAESELTAEEAISVLAKNVSRRRWSGAPKTIFEGRVDGPRFRISSAVHSIDSFNPLMRGSVLPYGAGCIVRVVMMPHPVTVIFMAAWSLLFAVLAGAHGRITPVAWVVITLPLLVGIGGFIYSVPHNKRILKQCLKLRVPEEEEANNSPQPETLARHANKRDKVARRTPGWRLWAYGGVAGICTAAIGVSTEVRGFVFAAPISAAFVWGIGFGLNWLANHSPEATPGQRPPATPNSSTGAPQR